MIETFVARFLLVAFRVGGLMSFAPFYANLAITMPVRAGLVLFISFLMFPVVGGFALPSSIGAWLGMALSEAMLGLLAGFTCQFVIEGMILAGEIASFQFGFSLENIIDPNTQVSTTVLATLYELTALLILLQLGVHRWLLRAIGLSFRLIPPGSLLAAHVPVSDFLRAATALWLIGVEIAFPVVLVTMLTDLTVGYLAKAAPQFPAVFFGISAKALLGMLLLSATVAFWPRLLERDLYQALVSFENLLLQSR